MRVLLVKLSSMGDLIHALAAITDAQTAMPDIEFDWVVDEAFADIPLMHPAVKGVIKSAHRRWVKTKWQALRSGELLQFWRALRARKYDMVLDAQSSWKSALVTRLARGLRYGIDKVGSREYGVQLAYQKTVAIPHAKQAHALSRQRLLFAKALGYALPEGEAYFGIDINSLPALPLALPQPYLVFIHSTTWQSKHWPERYWAKLINLATAAGYHVVLPWGNKHEHQRAVRLASRETVHILPKLTIPQQARVIHGACGVVAVDTGLAHLSAALRTPTVHLYGSTDVRLLGIPGKNQLYAAAQFPCSPCYLRVCKFGQEAACFVADLGAEKVWDLLLSRLNK